MMREDLAFVEILERMAFGDELELSEVGICHAASDSRPFLEPSKGLLRAQDRSTR
jgi:hypothetical protein